MATVFGGKKPPKTYDGKSTALGHGGRAAKLNDKLEKEGLSEKSRGAIIGSIARKKGAAPGGKNYHGKRGGKGGGGYC